MESEQLESERTPPLLLLLLFLVFIKKEADEVPQIRTAALCLKLHANK